MHVYFLPFSFKNQHNWFALRIFVFTTVLLLSSFLILSSEEKWKIRTYPPYTTPTDYGTDSFTSPTPAIVTVKKPKTPKVTPTRKRVTTLTKRKKTRTNSTVRRSRVRTTKAPHSTKHTTAPKTLPKTTSKLSTKHTTAPKTLPETTSKLSTLSSIKMSTKGPITRPNTSTKVTPTTLAIVFKSQTTKKRVKDTTTEPEMVSKGVTTVKPSTTVLKSHTSVPLTNPVASTDSTVTTERDKKSKAPTTSTGVQITIQVNGTNYTLPNKTLNTTLRPSILTITPKGLPSDNTQNSPSPKAASSAAPVVMGQASPEVVMGVAGSLYLWFLHMKGQIRCLPLSRTTLALCNRKKLP